MRYVYIAFAFVVVLTVTALGLRGPQHTSTKPPIEVFDDMDRQSKYKAQGHSSFFGDGRTDRPTPANAVAYGRSSLKSDVEFSGNDTQRFLGQATGSDGKPAVTADGHPVFAKGFPASVPVTHELLARGQNRYNIYCLPCHGRLGDGNGITKIYGMAGTPTYHDARIRSMPEGEIFNTITNGFKTMQPYGDKLSTEDRWAVIAYVRALQRAQLGTSGDVPAADKAKLGL